MVLYNICTVVQHLPHTALPCFHFQGCLDKKMKMLQFLRQEALIHAGEVTVGMVTGEDRHGELVLSVLLLVLILLHFTEVHNL